ncbi:MAG: NAD(+) synthase [Longimicrobiales bacterium]
MRVDGSPSPWDVEQQAPRNAGRLRSQLSAWLRDQVEGSRAGGVVFGLSGGIDSAVVCGLCVDALGPRRCLALIMPIESHDEDAQLAHAVAERFGVTAMRLDLHDPFRMILQQLEEASHGLDVSTRRQGAEAAESGVALARANLKPRLRMIALYYFSNLLDYRVIGTGNAAERLVGYFTKWGDGAADLAPLGDLLKVEVVALARELGVPQRVIQRPPSAGLWAGQTDEEELGLRYDDIDRYLLTGSSGDEAVDRTVQHRVDAARHKIEPPPVARPD